MVSRLKIVRLSARFYAACEAEMLLECVLPFRESTRKWTYDYRYPVVFRVQVRENKSDVIMDVMSDMEHISKHNIIADICVYLYCITYKLSPIAHLTLSTPLRPRKIVRLQTAEKSANDTWVRYKNTTPTFLKSNTNRSSLALP